MFRNGVLLLAAVAQSATLEPRFLQTALLKGTELQRDPETEKALDENLRAQERAHSAKQLVSQSFDIDTKAAAVANETGSPALAAMLGSMYKDMRTFAKPSHIKYLNNHQAKLEQEEDALRAKLAAEDAEGQAEDDTSAAAGTATKADKESDDKESDDKESDDKESDDEEETDEEPAAAKKVESDYNEETEFHEVVPLVPKSSLPVTVEYFIAFAWVLFVASVPFVLATVTGKEQTFSDKMLTVTLLIVLFGGIYLFTNIIIFQSAHFTTQRPLTLVECVYMMSQVITTVGYGDVTPARQRGQVFVGFYVITSFLVIAVMMSNLVSYLIQVAKVRLAGDDSVGSTPRGRDPTSAWMRTKEAISYRNLRFNFLVYLFFAVTWSIFFANMPGEGKRWYEAVYMSIITLSTVGFGAFTATTEAGKVFAAFWMIFGSLALVGVIGEFTNTMSKARENEDYHAAVNNDAIAAYEQETGQTSMSEADFIQFYMLNRKLTSQEELQAYRGAFRTLSAGRPGRQQTASASEIADIVEHASSFSKQRGSR